MDQRFIKLAHSLINYSVRLQKGEKILLEITDDGIDLAKALVEEVYKVGGVPFLTLKNSSLQRALLMNCTKEQMEEYAEYESKRMKDMVAYISVRASYNSTEMSDVPADKMHLFQKYWSEPVHSKIRVPHTKWCILRYPNGAMSQGAGMATKAQTGPVFLAYRSQGLLNALLLKFMGNHQPVYDFTSSDEIKHTLYVVDDPIRVGEITELFKQVPHMYIADGHHRSAAALRVAEELAKRPNQTGEEEYNYFLSVIFPDTMLHILAYNRVVKDLKGLSVEAFMTAVAKNFTVEIQKREPEPKELHTFGMFIAGRWYSLKAKENTFKAEGPIQSLDVSILQNNLLTPILGIQDPRTDKRISFVGGIKGTKKLEELVSDGKYAVAFAMYPTSMDQLMAVADKGLIMPPKSTWFEPKLRDAMTIHLIGDEQDGKSI